MIHPGSSLFTHLDQDVCACVYAYVCVCVVWLMYKIVSTDCGTNTLLTCEATLAQMKLSKEVDGATITIPTGANNLFDHIPFE